MNFHEQQLRRFTAPATAFKSAKLLYAGRVAFLPLSGNRRARLEFVTCGTADTYEALRVTIIKIDEGKIDTLTLSFKDYFAEQAGGCSGRVVPHIWVYNSETSWYKTPTDSEIKKLTQAAHDYIMLFA